MSDLETSTPITGEIKVNTDNKGFDPKKHRIVLYNINLDDTAFFEKVRKIEAKGHVDFLITIDGKKHEMTAAEMRNILSQYFDWA